MSFYTNDPVFCPNCPPRFRKSMPDEQVGVRLDCTESNYSGCSVDIAECPECRAVFQVSYKVNEIKEI